MGRWRSLLLINVRLTKTSALCRSPSSLARPKKGTKLCEKVQDQTPGDVEMPDDRYGFASLRWMFSPIFTFGGNEWRKAEHHPLASDLSSGWPRQCSQHAVVSIFS